jgi:hypothetical protein
MALGWIGEKTVRFVREVACWSTLYRQRHDERLSPPDWAASPFRKLTLARQLDKDLRFRLSFTFLRNLAVLGALPPLLGEKTFSSEFALAFGPGILFLVPALWFVARFGVVVLTLIMPISFMAYLLLFYSAYFPFFWLLSPLVGSANALIACVAAADSIVAALQYWSYKKRHAGDAG